MKEQAVASGATPQGVAGERQAASWVQAMFGQVAPRYDLLNHLLSFNIDRLWRRALLNSLAPALARPDALVLDLCCGTGDVLIELQKHSQARIFGADFSRPMLQAAQRKIGSRALLVEGDAMRLPLGEGTLDAVAISFGFRNLSNYRDALHELARVSKPDGVLAILEFSHPRNVIVRWTYSLYSRFWLPVVGRLISGSADAYSYLPDSIRKFPSAPDLARMMANAGFERVHYQLLSGGIAALHTGLRKPRGGAESGPNADAEPEA